MASYSSNEAYKIGHSSIYLPQMSVKTGMSYTYKFLTADFDNTFWVNNVSTIKFQPIQSKFEIGLEARTGEFKIRMDHTCWHPVATDGQKLSGIYGGESKISVSYGY